MERIWEFERHEAKYLVPSGDIPALIRAASPFCSADSYNSGDEGYPVHSLYLDSPSRFLNRAALRDDPDRVKLRVRSYGPTGPVRLEIKRKTGGIILKARAKVPSQYLEDAAHGWYVDDAHSPAERDALELFAQYVNRVGLEPTLLVRYRRLAFVSTVNDYARITIDSHLEYSPTSDWSLSNPYPWQPLIRRNSDATKLSGDYALVEIKCEQRIPFWLTEIVSRFEMNRTPFSKYSLSVAQQEAWDRGNAEVAFV
ncbi:MAG: polyphosphate polymerase domain-containing protein [Myxococcales bacterium]|nr:polyphosphate polymerase domain-containing protein [Myxococcales bacterium]